MGLIRKIRSFLSHILFLMSGGERIHYINGAETLPPPMPPEEEARFIAAAEAGDETARKKLIEHNLRLVVYIARKFDTTPSGIEDIISIGSIGLIKAINTFRADKNIKLATYASRCIENEILMYLRKSSFKKHEVSIDEPLNTDWDGNELLLSDVLGTDEDIITKHLDEAADHQMLAEAVARLSERDKMIVRLRFGIGDGVEQTQKDVADMLGISQSYISRLEKKIIGKLKKELLKNM